MTQALAAVASGIPEQTFSAPDSVAQRPVLSRNGDYGFGYAVSAASLYPAQWSRKPSPTMASVPPGLRNMSASTNQSPSRSASIATALSSLVAVTGIIGELVAGGVAFGAVAAFGLAVLAVIVLAHEPR